MPSRDRDVCSHTARPRWCIVARWPPPRFRFAPAAGREITITNPDDVLTQILKEKRYSLLFTTVLACIGPHTSATAVELGLRVAASLAVLLDRRSRERVGAPLRAREADAALGELR